MKAEEQGVKLEKEKEKLHLELIQLKADAAAQVVRNILRSAFTHISTM